MHPHSMAGEDPKKQQPIGKVPQTRQVHVSNTIVGALPGTTPQRPPPSLINTTALKRTPTSLVGQVKRVVPAFKIFSDTEPKASPPPTDKEQQTDNQNVAKKIKTDKLPPSHINRTAGGETWQDPTLADWDPNDFRIFVGDLGPEVTDIMLHQAFSKFGSITKTRVVRDKNSSKSKGYGFVGFKEPQDFLKAIREMNGKYIGSRPVKLRKSTWTDRCTDVSSHKRSKIGETPPSLPVTAGYVGIKDPNPIKFGPMGKRPNLALELGILEASKGLEPTISKCKNIAYKRSLKGKVLDPSEIDNHLQTVRNERISRKLFSVRKNLQKAVKKARTFAIQKLIKKMKGIENLDKKMQIEMEMRGLKSLKLPEVTEFVLSERIIKGSPYLTEKLTANQLPKMPEIEKMESVLIPEGPSLNKNVQGITDDFEMFLKKLFHELPRQEKPTERKDENSFNTTRDRIRRPHNYEYPSRDDEPRKNRKGQRARRQEWEKLYGSQARHLQESQTRHLQRGPSNERIKNNDNSEEHLHPSWEAKRRQKELERSAAAIRSQPNAHIKFEED